MNREPINPDDPQMSAYALGELSVAEAAEFEARLQESPMARAELASMREIMGLLSMGLRHEWREGASLPKLSLLEPFETGASSTVVVGNFRQAPRKIASIAAVAAVLAVGSMALLNLNDRTETVPLAAVPSAEMMPLQGSDLFPAGPVATHVPRLLLAEEVDDESTLDLAIDSGDLGTRIDPSYLDADHVIPAGFAPAGGQGRVISPDRGQEMDRVDSYLPPLIGIASGRGMTTGMIEKRLGREGSTAKVASLSSDRVLVSGYVTMGGESITLGDIEAGSLGFRPVSISSNPVADEERGLQILADMNGLENELSRLFEELPADSSERADLGRILEKSRRVVSQLRAELSH